MPIVWKLVLKSYIKVFLQCLVIVFTLELILTGKTIAKSISYGSQSIEMLIYYLNHCAETSYWTFGICSAIAAFSTYYKLSSSGELSALRSLGISIAEIERPVILGALAISILTFAVVSELTPYTYAKQKEFSYKLALGNPLLLVEQRSIPSIQGCYASLNLSSSGKKATSPVIIQNNPTTNRLMFYTADEFITTKKGSLVGNNLSIITHLPSKTGSDHTVVQNYANISLNTSQLAPHYRPTYTDFYYFRYLPLKFLVKHWSAESMRQLTKRISYSLFPLMLTLLAISLSRVRLFQTALSRLILLLLFLVSSAISLIIAKNQPLKIGILLFLTPHVFVWVYTRYARIRTDKGVLA